MRLPIAILTAALFSTGVLRADTITVNLGTSNQVYTLVGTGGSNGFGTYLAQQGTCVDGSSLTTCTLTGSYTGTTPGFDAGSYTLTTTYNISDGGLAATSTTPVAADGGNYFNFNPFSSDVNMDLLLVQTAGGTNAVTLVSNGVFVANSYFLGGNAPSCGNLPPETDCTQGNVGLTNGGTYSGHVGGGVIFTPNVSTSVLSTVPEPGWLALGGMLPGVLMFARRRFLS